MKPEKQNLIHDLLDDDSSREAILSAGNRLLRHRRQYRAAKQILAVLTLIIATAAFYLRIQTRRAPGLVASQNASLPATGPQVQALTDDQLLALFPNTPVGLVTLADGKKRLIFPRPGDEQRFITPLPLVRD